MEPTPEALERRRRWFDGYMERLEHLSVRAPKAKGIRYPCPCCGCRTLDERGGFDICPVCFWEDDGQDDADAATVRGGPNGGLSLTQARENYGAFGACDQRFVHAVRKARAEERGTG
jgi:hypothetical protein